MGKRLSVLFHAWIAILVLLPAASTCLASTPNLYVHRDKLSQALQEDVERAVIGSLGSIGSKAEDAGGQWQDAAKALAFRKAREQIRAALEKNPELMKKLKSGEESARRIYKKILQAQPFGGYVKAAYSDYKEGKSKEILEKLTAKLSAAKEKIEALTRLSSSIEDAAEKAEYTEILQRYGVDGAWVDRFGKQEKSIRTAVKYYQGQYGDYYTLFKTIHEGMEGKELGSEARALFNLMESLGGKVPILGDFIEAYGQLAIGMLDATLRLKKAFAKWDMGCLGAGTHDWLSKKSNPLNYAWSRKYVDEGTACPEGDVKNLYENLELSGKFYYWTGETWIHTRTTQGGIGTLRRIMTMVAEVQAQYGSHTAKADVPTAFTFYDMDYPGGFPGLVGDAEDLLERIRRRGNDLKYAWLGAKGSSETFRSCMRRIAGYDEDDIVRFSASKKNLFLYRFALGAQKGKTGAYQKYTDMAEALASTVVLHGDVKAAEKPEALDLAVEGGGASRCAQVSAETMTYRVLARVGPGETLTCAATTGTLSSRPVRVAGSAAQPASRKKDLSLAGITVEMKGPDEEIRLNEKYPYEAHIQGGTPPYEITWRSSDNKSASKTTEKSKLRIRKRFKTPGAHWVALEVEDREGLRAEGRYDFEIVALELALLPEKTVLEPGEKVKVRIRITGGEPPYRITGLVSGTLKTRKGKFTYTAPEQPGEHALKLSAKDKEDRTVTGEARVEVARAFEVTLVPEKTTLDPEETMQVNVEIAGGKPPFRITGLVQGTLKGRKGRFSYTAPKAEGTYPLRVRVNDSSDPAFSADRSVTVEVKAAESAVKARTVVEAPKAVDALALEPMFDLSGVRVTVVHSRVRAPEARQIVDFLLRSGARADARPRPAKMEGKPSKHKGAIYASRMFAGKARLIARQLERVEPLEVRVYTELKTRANHLTLWLL